MGWALYGKHKIKENSIKVKDGNKTNSSGNWRNIEAETKWIKWVMRIGEGNKSGSVNKAIMVGLMLFHLETKSYTCLSIRSVFPKGKLRERERNSFSKSILSTSGYVTYIF